MIVINNFKMPKSCLYCPLAFGDDCCITENWIRDFSKRLEDCPLIEFKNCSSIENEESRFLLKKIRGILDCNIGEDRIFHAKRIIDAFLKERENES